MDWKDETAGGLADRILGPDNDGLIGTEIGFAIARDERGYFYVFYTGGTTTTSGVLAPITNAAPQPEFAPRSRDSPDIPPEPSPSISAQSCPGGCYRSSESLCIPCGPGAVREDGQDENSCSECSEGYMPDASGTACEDRDGRRLVFNFFRGCMTNPGGVAPLMLPPRPFSESMHYGVPVQKLDLTRLSTQARDGLGVLVLVHEDQLWMPPLNEDFEGSDVRVLYQAVQRLPQRSTYEFTFRARGQIPSHETANYEPRTGFLCSRQWEGTPEDFRRWSYLSAPGREDVCVMNPFATEAAPLTPLGGAVVPSGTYPRHMKARIAAPPVLDGDGVGFAGVVRVLMFTAAPEVKTDGSTMFNSAAVVGWARTTRRHSTQTFGPPPFGSAQQKYALADLQIQGNTMAYTPRDLPPLTWETTQGTPVDLTRHAVHIQPAVLRDRFLMIRGGTRSGAYGLADAGVLQKTNSHAKWVPHPPVLQSCRNDWYGELTDCQVAFVFDMGAMLGMNRGDGANAFSQLKYFPPAWGLPSFRNTPPELTVTYDSRVRQSSTNDWARVLDWKYNSAISAYGTDLRLVPHKMITLDNNRIMILSGVAFRGPMRSNPRSGSMHSPRGARALLSIGELTQTSCVIVLRVHGARVPSSLDDDDTIRANAASVASIYSAALLESDASKWFLKPLDFDHHEAGVTFHLDTFFWLMPEDIFINDNSKVIPWGLRTLYPRHGVLWQYLPRAKEVIH